jgi:beta-galactosidase
MRPRKRPSFVSRLQKFGAAVHGMRAYSLDLHWKFALEVAAPISPCPAFAFASSLDGQKTTGLVEKSAITEERCASECCSDSTCETYQFCNSTDCGSGPPQQPSCWIGRLTGAKTRPSKGWIGKGRDAPLTPPPPPPPPSETHCSEAWCHVGTDDSAWRSVSVPHDFVVEGKFTPAADVSHGSLPYGVGLYRKRLALPPVLAASLVAGRQLAFFEFEGAQTSSTVYLNGQLLGAHASGYTPFAFPLSARHVARARATGFRSGGGGSGRSLGGDDAAADLLLAVRVDATRPDSWWYDGGGLYRHVRLAVVPAMHLARPGGVYLPSRVSGAIDTATMTADALVSPRVAVASPKNGPFSLLLVVHDAAGKEVGRSEVRGEANEARSNVTVALPPIALAKAALWSTARPTLYEVTTTLTDETSGAVDLSVISIGVRQAEWSAARGFSLNGVPTKILGAANHQDFAGVGVAVPDALQAHRVAKLQQMGCNGWRTAHNAPTPTLLDATDRLGVLVWDENHRNGQDDELRRLVLRDRNHPSIVLWSICNEKLCDSSDTLADAKRLHALFHALDPGGGRVVSANYNGWLGPDTPLDVQGIDYATQTYDEVHESAPA